MQTEQEIWPPSMAKHFNNISRSDIDGENRVDVMFSKDGFRTPSPLLPSWHRPETSDAAAMDEDSGDDFYFHSSGTVDSNVRLFDNKSVSYGSLNGNQAVHPEVSDNCHLQSSTPVLHDSCSYSSRSSRTDRMPNGGTCMGSQFSMGQRFIVDRSKCSLHCMHIFVI